MVSLTLRLELPDWEQAGELAPLVRALGEDVERRGGRVVKLDYTGTPTCQECGGEMEYDITLQAHVCHHGE